MDPHLLHLRLNHLPVVGSFWTLAVVLFALLRPTPPRSMLAFALAVLLALTVGAAFLTGEPAEEKVEHAAGVVERAIQPHEEAAETVLWTSLVFGAVAVGGMVLVRRGAGREARLLLVTVALGVLVQVGLLARAAHLGGLIHRPELSGQAPAPAEEIEDSD